MVINVTEIRKKQCNRFMTDNEAVILWQFAKKWSLKWQLMLAFALFRGLRIGEILAINILDFSDNFSKLRVITEKTHREEVLPLIPDLVIIVKEYIIRNKHTLRDGYLFPYYSSKLKKSHMTTPTAEALFSKLRKQIGKENISFLDKDRPDSKYYRIGFHSCRRWFETRIYDKTKDRVMLKDIMRYFDSRTVDTYIDPYETWKNEQTILESVFNDKILTMSAIVKGQKTLNTFY